MFTVCPKCALTLVVTAADLRVAQGYVRCGRCSSVFNALAQLSDERAARAGETPLTEREEEVAEPEAPEEPEEPQAAEPEAPANPPAAVRSRSAPQPAPLPPPAAEQETIPEDALEFDPDTTDAASVFVAASPSPEWTAATGSFKALVAANQEPVASPGPGAGDEVDIELDAALLSHIMGSAPGPGPSAPAATPEAVPASPREPAGPTPAPPQRAALQSRSITPAAARPAPAERVPQGVETPPEDDTGDFLPVEPAAEPAAARSTRLWAAGAALLTLVLLAQIIDHQRDTLAADPRFGHALTALYAALGVTLTPRWDLRAYDVRQLGATVDPGTAGAITVRASIRNAGQRPQPLPLLRVTLQDRFGNRLASRDVPPRDYLPRSAQPTALLSRDQRIDAELAFVDPGANAVGFELDACLPVRGGIACANDASGR
jgi:predicted Zn finger-like uncharacterized protein